MADGFSSLDRIRTVAPAGHQLARSRHVFGRAARRTARSSRRPYRRRIRDRRGPSASAARSGSTTSGTLTPLWLDSSPPVITRVRRNRRRSRSTRRRSLPSSSSRSVPAVSAANTSGCGSGRPLVVARRRVEVEAERRRRLRDGPCRRRIRRPAASGPAGRPARRSAGRPLSRRRGRVVAGLVVGMGAVAEIEAEHIGAGGEQALDRARGRGGRPEGGDDLGFTASSYRHRRFGRATGGRLGGRCHGGLIEWAKCGPSFIGLPRVRQSQAKLSRQPGFLSVLP